MSLSAQENQAIIAGLVNPFPAMFTVSMVSLWLSQGKAVGIGAVSPMVLGITSLNVFVLVVGIFLQHVYTQHQQYVKYMPIILSVAYVSAITSISIPTYLFFRYLTSQTRQKSKKDDDTIATKPKSKISTKSVSDINDQAGVNEDDNQEEEESLMLDNNQNIDGTSDHG